MTFTIQNKKRKGVNIADFVARRGAELLVRNTKRVMMPVETPVAMVVPVVQLPKDRARVVAPKPAIVQKTRKTETPPMFKFVQADGVRDPLKLLEYIQWCATYGKDRTPPLQKDLAVKLRIDEDTLSLWKRKLGFWDEVKIYRDQYMRRYTSKIADAIGRRAALGDPRAAELFFKTFEALSSKIEVEGNLSSQEVTPEETARIADALKNIGLAAILSINGTKIETTETEVESDDEDA